MRILRSRRGRPNQVTLAVAFDPGEEIPIMGEAFGAGPYGVATVLSVRRADVPEAGEQSGDRVYHLSLLTLETTGDVADIG